MNRRGFLAALGLSAVAAKLGIKPKKVVDTGRFNALYHLTPQQMKHATHGARYGMSPERFREMMDAGSWIESSVYDADKYKALLRPGLAKDMERAFRRNR